MIHKAAISRSVKVLCLASCTLPPVPKFLSPMFSSFACTSLQKDGIIRARKSQCRDDEWLRESYVQATQAYGEIENAGRAGAASHERRSVRCCRCVADILRRVKKMKLRDCRNHVHPMLTASECDQGSRLEIA
eukprot:2762140-Rhodomonas_salina.1